MKSNMKKGMIALMLCMVMLLSGSTSALADDANAEMNTVETVQEVQAEPAALSEEPAQPETAGEPEATVEATVAAPTETETETAGGEADAPQATETAPEAAVTEDTPQTAAETTPHQDAMELTQEMKDADGNTVCTVKAEIPEGTFQANTSEVTMEVTDVDEPIEKEIKELMKKKLPDGKELGHYFLYNVSFKVNGQTTEPGREIKITFDKKDFRIEDVKKANVFYYNEANSPMGNTEAEIIEIIQKADKIEELQKAGESADNIDDYDLSEISLKADGTADKIQTEGRRSTVYGCYIEKLSKEKVYTAKVGEVEVTVTAPKGAFNRDSDKVYMTAEELTKERKQEVEKILTAKAEENDEELVDYKIYDINLWKDEAHTEKIQPQIPVTVNFKNLNLENTEAETITPIRIDEEAQTATEVSGTATGENVEMTAEHFTEYGAKMTRKKPGIETYSSTGDGTLATNDPIAVNIANDYLPGTENNPVINEQSNEWQVARGMYTGTGAPVDSVDKMQTTEDGLFRYQKSLIPTGIENEFYVYLNIEPQMKWDWKRFFEGTWLCCSNNEVSDNISFPESATATQVQDATGANVGKICETESDAKNPDNATNISKIWTINEIVLKDQNGGVADRIPGNFYVALPSITENSATILYVVPGTTKVSKLSNLEFEGDKSANRGTLYVPYDSWKGIHYEEQIDDYSTLSSAADLETITDPMGEVNGNYIEFINFTDQTGGTTYEADGDSANDLDVDMGAETITWTGFSEPTASSNAADYYKIGKTVYRKNAYQLLYKIRLEVENDSFNSCAEFLSDSTQTDYIYSTNDTTTLSYSYEDDENITQNATAEFDVPEVRGLLYDIEFQKVDDKGNALPEITFTLSGTTGYGQNLTNLSSIVTTAVSDENGWVKFRNIPWGNYTIKEELTEEQQELYFPVNDIDVTPCYTTDRSLPQDHGTGHTVDLENDIKNKLVLANGGIVTNREKTGHTVVKEWVGAAPEGASIDVILKATVTLDGKETELNSTQLPGVTFEHSLSENTNNWTYTWQNLPKYYYYGESQEKQVLEINYTVEETMDDALAAKYDPTTTTDGKVTTITNTPKAVWKILKVSTSNDSVLLPNAEFTLRKTAEVDGAVATTSVIYYGKSAEDGTNKGLIEWYSNPARTDAYKINNSQIEAGIYTLSETKAPEGYAISTEKWIVEFVTAGALPVITCAGKELEPEIGSVTGENGVKLTSYTYKFKNTPVYDLPSAGGPGIYWYMIGGMLLMLAAALILYKNKCKEVLES